MERDFAGEMKKRLAGAIHNGCDVLFRRQRQGDGARRSVGIWQQHAVNKQRMQVDVEVQRASESLHECDGASLGFGMAAAFHHLFGDDIGEDACRLAQHIRLRRYEHAKLVRQRQYPLANGRARQDTIDDMCGLVGHSAPRTRWADASTLAGVADDKLVAAVRAANAGESFAQDGDTCRADVRKVG